MVISANTDMTSNWECVQKDGYKIYQSGSHKNGNFMRIFVPESHDPDKPEKLKLITYLHGFALCMPKFYECHLAELAQKGYYIFFPDFQKSDYPDDILDSKQVIETSKEKSKLSYWFRLLIMVVIKGKNFQAEDFLSEEQKAGKNRYNIPENLTKRHRYSYLRIALALVLFIVVVNVIYSWFRRNYAKNLIHLVSTVAYSLMYAPGDWIKNAIALTKEGWTKVCEDNPVLAEKEFEFYVFGHSLGGLLALSWPAFIDNSQDPFFPKQIITADPALSTEMGIPQIALLMLKIVGSPFAKAPINISDTGKKLNIPVAIMHGADDNLVKPESWVKPSFWQKKSNLDYIDSPHKKIYFSLSNSHNKPPLIAFHNQAVTDTTYFDDALFKNFGGVKKGPNDYNLQYVWPGLELVVKGEVRADELLNKFPRKTIQITETLPKKPWNIKLIAIAIFTTLALLGLGYWWFWHSGHLFSYSNPI